MDLERKIKLLENLGIKPTLMIKQEGVPAVMMTKDTGICLTNLKTLIRFTGVEALSIPEGEKLENLLFVINDATEMKNYYYFSTSEISFNVYSGDQFLLSELEKTFRPFTIKHGLPVF